SNAGTKQLGFDLARQTRRHPGRHTFAVSENDAAVGYCAGFAKRLARQQGRIFAQSGLVVRP
ncbi:MAG: hypothetical protein ABJO05_19685, partial [Roseibium sp.]